MLKNCGCCGEEFETTSHMRKYAPGHTPSHSDRARTVSRRKTEEQIPAKEFHQTLLRIKAEQGMTWEQMADKTGRTLGSISSYSRKSAKWVSREHAEELLLRLSGAPLPPTPLQEAKYTALRRKDQSEQRAVTLSSNKLDDRKASVAALRVKLGSLSLD